MQPQGGRGQGSNLLVKSKVWVGRSGQRDTESRQSGFSIQASSIWSRHLVTGWFPLGFCPRSRCPWICRHSWPTTSPHWATAGCTTSCWPTRATRPAAGRRPGTRAWSLSWTWAPSPRRHGSRSTASSCLRGLVASGGSCSRGCNQILCNAVDTSEKTILWSLGSLCKLKANHKD